MDARKDSPHRIKTLLILSQVYVPDPASVGQHMHDVATEMVRRGHRVIVFAASRGYDDPSRKYASREIRDGVEIRRLPLSSFGKSSVAVRLLAGLFFVLQCILRGLFVRNPQAVLVSTSPPMCSLAAVVIGMIRRVPIKYWVMDLNPDQMVAMGRIGPASLPARALDWLNRLILRRADVVVVLDRFMAKRVRAKEHVAHKMTISPPWPHEDHLEVVRHEENPFRREHGWDEKFVFMYSGNHSLSSPLTTVLAAALAVGDRHDAVFAFIGGGLGKAEIDQAIKQHRCANIFSLPYQPLGRIKYSLSAADVHIVALGPAMVGIIHPCKVYGAMAIGRPILFLGPADCHVADILRQHHVGWRIEHGDVSGAERTLRAILDTDRDELRRMGERARRLSGDRFSMERLRGEFCDTLAPRRAA